MSSPVKTTKKVDKENECQMSPNKSSSPLKGPSKVAFFALGNNRSTLQRRDSLLDKNIIMEGLKPMDVNTSFDEEVPDEWECQGD